MKTSKRIILGKWRATAAGGVKLPRNPLKLEKKGVRQETDAGIVVTGAAGRNSRTRKRCRLKVEKRHGEGRMQGARSAAPETYHRDSQGASTAQRRRWSPQYFFNSLLKWPPSLNDAYQHHNYGNYEQNMDQPAHGVGSD
jgi:hypothetical protein